MPGDANFTANPTRKAIPHTPGKNRPAQRPIRPAQEESRRPTRQPTPAQTNQPPPPRIGRHRGCLWSFAVFLLLGCGLLTVSVAAVGGLAYARLDQLVDARLEEFAEYRGFESTFIYARNHTDGVPSDAGCARKPPGRDEPHLLYELFGEGRRQHVPLEQMPVALLQAIIATEDEAFYRHLGIDIPATLQAAWRFLTGNRLAPGGSTIHQQLVRNVLFAPEYRAERSIRRKAEEIILALALDRRYAKDEVLEMYLNEVYYGNLAYGAQAAAQTFFCKEVSDLSVGEAALLAGLPQAPASLDPLSSDPATQAAVLERWLIVLDAMVDNGFLTEAEKEHIHATGLVLQQDAIRLEAPHFTIHLLGELEEKLRSLGYQPDLVTPDGVPIFGGFRVYSTLDTRLNELSRDVITQQLCQSKEQRIGNGAAVVLKPSTGEVLAMMGSANYHSHDLAPGNPLIAYEYDDEGRCTAVHVVDGQVNVTTRRRQPGSAIKPITYAAALERQVLNPGTVLWDTETSITIAGQPDYEPRNYDGRYHGPMTLRTALANSYNIPAVQTLRALGVENLLETMNRFGLQSLADDPSQYGLSLTLGGGEITLLELTRAYTIFVNQGRLLPSRSIRCILDMNDAIIYEFAAGCPRGEIVTAAMLANCEAQPSEAQAAYCSLPTPSQQETVGGKAVLDARIAYLIQDILSDNVARSPAMGANSALHIPNLPAAVKTGTTDDFKDNWTVGTTANVAVGVWVGNTRGEPMRNTTGLSGAAPIWNAILRGIYDEPKHLLPFAEADGRLRSEVIPVPAAMTLQEICDVRQLREPATHCSSTTTEWFLDSPPARPDAQGQLQIPPSPVREPELLSDVDRVEVSPSVYALRAQPLPANISEAIDFGLPRAEAPPPPLYCQIPQHLAPSAPGAQTRLFLAPPPDAQDAIAAERFARENGYAFLPTIVCTPELLALARSQIAQVVTAFISRPYADELVTEGMAIQGSVQFAPEQAQFYKLELRGGPYFDWITLGDIHQQPVADGPLEWLPVLPRGDYQLRLVVVGWDGNFVQPPYQLSFRVP